MSQLIAFTGPEQVEVQTFDPPAFGDNELLIRTEYSGVSQGTEVWALTGRRRELTFPTVPGYQSVGIVEAVGANVTGFAVGQRVLFHASRLPEDATDTWMGGHVSHAISPTTGDPPPRVVPEGVDPKTAALAAMWAVSLRGVDMLTLKPNDLVVVTGLGLIGQAAAQLARLRGAIVVASDLHPTRLDLAKAYSADLVVDARASGLAEAIRGLRPKGADVVIDTTGRVDMFAPCVDLLRPLGQFLMQGFYPQHVNFDFHVTHLKRPTIHISCGIGDTQRVLELFRFDRLPAGPLITDVVPVDRAPAMYRRMLDADPNVLGVVFDWRGVS